MPFDVSVFFSVWVSENVEDEDEDEDEDDSNKGEDDNDDKDDDDKDGNTDEDKDDNDPGSKRRFFKRVCVVCIVRASASSAIRFSFSL